MKKPFQFRLDDDIISRLKFISEYYERKFGVKLDMTKSLECAVRCFSNDIGYKYEDS